MFEAESSLVTALEHSPSLNKVLHGHTAAVRSVAFSPDGKRLASASEDGTVRVWERHDGAARGPALKGHTAAVPSVAFSPDGKRLASASEDRTVRVWEATTGQQWASPSRGTRIGVRAWPSAPTARAWPRPARTGR